jgi:hypothetical protein
LTFELPVQAILDLGQFIGNVDSSLEPFTGVWLQAFPHQSTEPFRDMVFEGVPVWKPPISHRKLESVSVKVVRRGTEPNELLFERCVATAHAIQSEPELVDVEGTSEL